MEPTAGTTPPRHQRARDRTLYWTLSFYLSDSHVGAKLGDPCSTETRRLREAIEPLFNDIADRSSWRGQVEDRMFAAAPRERLCLRMPEQVAWSTEGRRFRVDVPDPGRERGLDLRRFWYQHGNGAISWHLSFDYFYGDDLAGEVRAGGAPLTYYFLSLLQKLAWPKEFGHPQDEVTTDDLVGIHVRRADANADAAGWTGFWAFAEALFREDATRLLPRACKLGAGLDMDKLLRVNLRDSIEIPGLKHHECRSLFFIRDGELFNLIQPVEDGRIVRRRERVADDEFDRYPKLIHGLVKADAEDEDAPIELGGPYWESARPRGDAAAETRLAYLFLAGFNQNIIDFMNQEASEVLDSLDPIYPKSEDQEEEGFFIRYANPRSMITYVKRSRTLEVGNDYIGTCPYAFLIHALAMHNEALTRAQERATFESIEAIREMIRLRQFEKAEEAINDVRIDAFDVYEQNRYHNPFRYDTERDVFDALEQLRGTSRRKQAYEMGLASLEEKTRDLAREREKLEDAQQRRRDSSLTILFGLLGVSGFIQVLYQWHQFTFGEPTQPLGWLQVAADAAYLLVPVLLAVLLWRRWTRADRVRDKPPASKGGDP